MKVKICGVTHVADAVMCAEAGADLLGLNFYPQSPRYLSRNVAADIAAAVRAMPHPPLLVGVFVNENAKTMRSILSDCALDLAQLSGDESVKVLAAMGERGFKAIRQPDAVDDSWLGAGVRDKLLLLDAHVPGRYGGTARTADWDSAARLAGRCRLLLAGGLTPENVAAAAACVRPWAVDVASGVESAPGVKDRAKVISFVERAKSP